jgi:CRP/FNR family transcriptional regulator, cyclic AMP receptor protein
MPNHFHFLWKDLFSKQDSEKDSVSPISGVLRKNVLFSTLTDREIRYLSEMVYERVYQPSESVFRENDRGLGMYMIRSGSIEIQSNSDHGDVWVTTLGPGSFFGEMALVDPEGVRSASARAAERTILIGFFISDLGEILERKPSMGVKILFQLSVVLARRLQETTHRISVLTETVPEADLEASHHEDAA